MNSSLVIAKMKFLYLYLLIVSTCAEKLENISGKEKLLRFKELHYEEEKAYENHKFEELLRNPDDNDIERPCDVFDKYCIRKFFAEHSRCKPVYGPVPDPLYKDQTSFHLPRLNLSFTSIDVLYEGFNGRIEEFYINRKTDKLVLAVEFTNFAFRTNTTYFHFHRVGQEPYKNVDYFSVLAPSVMMTIIIPNLKDLRFEDSEVVEAHDITPTVSLGPNAFSGSDPRIQATAEGYFSNVQVNSLESFYLDVLYSIQSFVQYSICDFGLILS